MKRCLNIKREKNKLQNSLEIYIYIRTEKVKINNERFYFNFHLYRATTMSQTPGIKE